MRALVTGGAGFIGSHLTEGLVSRGYEVRVLDNLCAGKKENLAAVMDRIELRIGDIRDKETVTGAMRGMDIVFHQAALRSVPASIDDPASFNEVNAAGTMNILIAAREEGIKRLVNASSSSVYGPDAEMPEKEDFRPAPISPYAASKMAGEYYCRVFSKVYGLETVSLRYFNVFGPRQDPHSKYAAVIAVFALRMLKDLSPEVHGDGEQSRDFSYVDNVVEANILAATAGNKEVSGDVFNIACSKEHSVLDVFNNINKILGKDVKAAFTPSRAGDVRRSLADISKAGNMLGYSPKVEFADGLKRTVEWFAASLKNEEAGKCAE